ncbi:hypothetical protein FV222_24030 [Methylobacterium sp. WL103]|uniref:hypothetical protein n=1 Tax=Methylobacterium sp. WL103 TaxID=2603891 RepID=UPI0011D52FB7|nr:hypothetical protein [Methylobacterium sp. WL103]TXM91841.1 hypothetical protein FV222_24030 [Methylobacterium sp. WL103]
MHSQALRRERALTAIEKSIQATLDAHSEYMAVLDARWRERVATKFADVSEEASDSASLDGSENTKEAFVEA